MAHYETYTLTMDGKSIRRARQAITTAATEWSRYDEEINKLSKVRANINGLEAYTAAQKRMNEIRLEKQDITRRAESKIAKCVESFAADLQRQTEPAGEQLDNPDFKLLSTGLIYTPEELCAVAERSQDKAAMRRVIHNYAVKNNWDGFAFADKLREISDFANWYFQTCVGAATDPVSSYSVLMLDEKVIAETAKKFMVLDEYNASMGKAAAADGEEWGIEE